MDMFVFLQSEEFYRAGLMVMSSFNFTWSWDNLISFSNMTDTFYGTEVRVGSCLFRLEIHNSQLSWPLEFGKKSGVVLMGLPVDVTW